MLDLQRIRSVPVLDVVHRLGIPVKRSGSAHMMCCPWHEDKKPSMQIGTRPERNHLYCYVCCESHDAIDLVMHTLHKSFREACGWIDPAACDVLPYDNGHRQRPQRRKAEASPGGTLAATEPSPGGTLQAEAPQCYCFPPDYLEGRVTMDSSFARVMAEVFGCDRAREVVEMYRLGALAARGRYPDVLFPSIDVRGRIRDIKVQAYDCDRRSEHFGHRLTRCPPWWLGAKEFPGVTFNRNCFFGEHLLARNMSRMVALVESPKNACFGAAVCPDITWVAAGSKSMLGADMLSVLHGRTVRVFPDNDAFDEWNAIIAAIPNEDFLTLRTLPPDGQTTCPKKWDIGDRILARFTIY